MGFLATTFFFKPINTFILLVFCKYQYFDGFCPPEWGDFTYAVTAFLQKM